MSYSVDPDNRLVYGALPRPFCCPTLSVIVSIYDYRMTSACIIRMLVVLIIKYLITQL